MVEKPEGVNELNIGFVTTQFPDLTLSGGISNPLLRLARSFVLNGHRVTVITTRTQNQITGEIFRKYKNLGIELVNISEDRSQISPWWLSMQHSVGSYLETCDFDVVISQEWQAPLALYSKLTSRSIPTITWLHGGTYYDALGNASENLSPINAVLASLEDLQIKKANAVVAPSKFIVDFYKSMSTINSRIEVIPLHFPDWNISQKPSPRKALAFVGAITPRKGFHEFLEFAESAMADDPTIEVRVYGNANKSEYAGEIKSFSQKHDNFSLKSNLQSEEIWEELSRFNTTLFVPSKLDNSPGVIYEALSVGAKVLVSGTQGGGELKDSSQGRLGIISEMSISEMLEFMNREEKSPIDVNEFNGRILQQWEILIKQILVSPPPLKTRKIFSSSVSVVIPTKNRAEMLEKAIKSVLNQSVLPKEIIIVDDNSTEKSFVPEIVRKLDTEVSIKVIRNERSLGPGACRNIGAKEAQFPILAFLDDDNLFTVNHIESCLKEMARSDLDAVTPFLLQVKNNDLRVNSKYDQVAVFAGGHFGSLNKVINLVCDSHILIKKDSFNAVRGFNEFRGASQEDWGLGLKLISNHFRFGTTAMGTVVYRINEDGVQYNGKGVTHWWPVNSFYPSLEDDNWVIGHIARIGFQDASWKKFKPSYVKYALRLLKSGRFISLFWGIKRYLGIYFR